jgi:hypothetical protein
MIVEYKLHKVRARSNNKKTPIWIDDGGYWYNSNNHTYVGCISDSAEHYIPSTLTVFTKETFNTRILTMHSVNPFSTESEDPETDPVAMTDAEVSTMANNWFDTKTTEWS